MRAQARITGTDPTIWRNDDDCAINDETTVGRIYKEMIHGEMKWRWFLQTDPAPPPNHGTADTWEEAKAAFKSIRATRWRMCHAFISGPQRDEQSDQEGRRE